MNPEATGDWAGRTRSPYPGEWFTAQAVMAWLPRWGFRYLDEGAPREPGLWGALAWPWRAWAGTTDRYWLLAGRR